ncbi:DUF927 domain-containing protein [Metallibacterium sp.]|uniref:DUF927 domain-containing protein n=1 Tax=Metallibacterium sp. TaxID=2940281 RepID=UPI002636048B|nr:DUF927 domain-containing protein [Metallibacterium sp.]
MSGRYIISDMRARASLEDRADSLPSGVRQCEAHADRELEAAERRPVESDRDSRDNRDTAQNKAPGCPGSVAPNRGNRDKTDGAHFELRHKWQGSIAPGVYWIGPAKGSDLGELAPPVWICDPLRIEALVRNDQGGEWGRLLVFRDQDGHEKRWSMPMQMLAGGGEELRAELLAAGLVISTSFAARQQLGAYISREHPANKARCVSRTGWQGNAFVLPRETLGDSEAERVIYQSASLEGVALAQAGTLDGWIASVSAPSAGNSRLVLAIAAGFAAPCLGLLGAEGGGVHYRGGSSTGKTTALRVAASMYGSPSYLRTWRATDNGLEGVAALHSDLLLVLDEIGQLALCHAGQVAYLLANGQGKGRSRRDGAPRPIATWRTLFLSAGEVGLADLVNESGGKVRAGQEVRVLDVPADAGGAHGLFEALPHDMSAGQFADMLKINTATHYGHAVPAFLRTLVSERDTCRDALRAAATQLADDLAPPASDGQVRRVAARFALIGAAGEMATMWALTGWRIGDAETAARACFRAWLAARGTAGASEPAAMVAQVRGFLEANGEARFTSWSADANGPRTINRAGYRRPTPEGPEYYVEREAFRHELCKGHDPQAVARVLIECGAIIPDSDGSPTRKERLPDGRASRVYRISPKLWGDNE